MITGLRTGNGHIILKLSPQNLLAFWRTGPKVSYNSADIDTLPHITPIAFYGIIQRPVKRYKTCGPIVFRHTVEHCFPSIGSGTNYWVVDTFLWVP